MHSPSATFLAVEVSCRAIRNWFISVIVPRRKISLDDADETSKYLLLARPCEVAKGHESTEEQKSGWRSGHPSRLPPLLQMLYVGCVSVDLNPTSS